jgi:phospholipid/cholesterol/gamma-HCH transport system permease protein
MTAISHIGAAFLGGCRAITRVSAAMAATLFLAAAPRNWRRTVRAMLARQIVFTAVDAVGWVLLIAVFAGISVVTQAQLWLSRFGQSDLLGPLLVAVIIREAGPLLVSFVVIGRSGTAISTELAGMTVRNEVRVLDAFGVEPMLYLVLPRVLGMTLSVLVLGVLFVLAALVSGHLFGVAMNATSLDFHEFWNSVLGAVMPHDFAVFLVKTLLSGCVAGTIACVEGLRVGTLVTEVPQAAIRAVVRSITAVLLLSALLSVITYSQP